MRVRMKEEQAKKEAIERQKTLMNIKKTSRFEVVPTEEVLVVKPLTNEEVEPYRVIILYNE